MSSRLRTIGYRAAITAAILLGASACGGDEEPVSDAAETAGAAASETTDEVAEDDVGETTTTVAETADTAGDTGQINGGKPDVDIPEGDAPLQLETIDLIDGDGAAAAPGDLLVMHYVGVLHENGEQFDASWDRGATFNFTLGQGRVIQGWDEGIVGMQEGGRRLLNIPPEQAYGSQDTGTIPANSALVFVVDLVSVLSPPVVENAPAPVTELEVTTLEEGDGEEIQAGSIVEFHFSVVQQSTGETIGASWDQGQPALVEIGVDPVQTVLAWDQALVGQRDGDVIRVVSPPELGPDDPQFEGETLVSVLTIMSVSN